jgi:addiction module RelE/StbE family toxin
MHKIRINPLAAKDLIEIKDYISKELERPKAAIKIINQIIESYSNLKKFPEMGLELSKKINIDTDFRYLISGKYIIFYRIEKEFISIYRILYSKRDYLKILFPKEI